MAIPGSKPEYEVRAKVRIGKKTTSRGGKEIPTSVDHFICDEPEFLRVVGEGKKELRIFLPFQHGEDAFRSGLEWWQGQMLVCYAKGDEQDGKPVALRKASMKRGGSTVNLLAGTELLSDETVGNDRRRIVCPVRECPVLKKKDCKPMGRLQFWIDGIGRDGGVYQLDTKSWNSVENIEKTLRSYSDLRGVPFILRVSFTVQGDNRFPELTLEAETVEINSPDDAALADALVQLRKAVDMIDGDEATSARRAALAAVLDLTNPGWREHQRIIDRIKDVGVYQAALATLERYGL